MAGNLYDRIKRHKSAIATSGPAARESREPGTSRIDYLGLDGWEQLSEHVFRRETLDTSVRSSASQIESALLGGQLPLSSIAFMDTETTGLSGGAGTVVFLVGSGSLGPEGIRVRQLLLGDYPGEPEFLAMVERDLGVPVWVSYNGKAFDSRLLESRFVMNGRPPMAAHQLDLLYWARRLWKTRLPACNLGTVEERILLRGRADDIPGEEIPDRFFQFTRTRDAQLLEDVFEHHRLDIVSLGSLFLRLESILRDPAADLTIDRFSLGRWLLRQRDPRGRQLLELVAREGDLASELGIVHAERASILVSRVLRKSGRSEEADAFLAGMAGRLPDSAALAVERAKLLEHDRRDPRTALELIETLGVQDERLMQDLDRRVARLRRKAARLS